MVDNRILKKYILPFLLATVAAALLSVTVLMLVNASLMKIPLQGSIKKGYAEPTSSASPHPNQDGDYKVITERNLFRAKLQIEVPKPRSEKEIEDEQLAALMSGMTLKGVWIGQQKEGSYAVIDKGGQKGVWTYELGEAVERGLAVSEIRPNLVKLAKGDFSATLRLFAKGYDREVAKPAAVTTAGVEMKPTVSRVSPVPQKPVDYSRDVRKEGNTVLISKSLADKMKTDNSAVLSAVAIRASVDSQGRPNGYRVVSVDRGSVAEKIGLVANDVVQEINGFRLNTSEDINKAYNRFKNESRFEVKVLRKGNVETIRYEIR
jgi:type II secretion system protein C